MAPLPKRKRSKSRQGTHRAHRGLRPQSLSKCVECGEMQLPHRVCRTCGIYAGRQVLPKVAE